jgi:ABC-type transport system involved in multi-copper enzyme maturation permease subunit
MTKLIKFELFKLHKSKKNKFLFGVLIVFLIGLIIFEKFQYNNFAKKEVEKYTSQEVLAIEALRNKYILLAKEENEVQRAKAEFGEIERKSSQILKVLLKDEKNFDSRTFLRYKIIKYENYIRAYEEGLIDDLFLRIINADISKLKLESFELKNFEESEMDFIANPYTVNGLRALDLLFRDKNPIILLGILALMVLDIFSSEIDEGSYKTIYTQPYSRQYIFISKIISSSIFVILTYIIVTIIFFIIVSFIYGIGDINYPVSIVSNNQLFSFFSKHNSLNEFRIISMGWNLLLKYLSFIPFLICTVIIGIAIVVILNSYIDGLSIIFVIGMIDYSFNILIYGDAKIWSYLPSSYLKIGSIFSGANRVSLVNGILIFLIISILFLIISKNKIVNRDLSGGV